MKVIHLISGGDVGGAKTHVLSLLEGLGKTEQVRLVCFREGDFAVDARKLGIDTVIMEQSVGRTIRDLSRMIRDEGFEIVHCHGSRANMTGAILRRKIRIPTVTTVHSDYRLDYLGRPLHRVTYGTINTLALRLFDYHIGVSDAMTQMLITRGFDPQTIFTIYNGVDYSQTQPKIDRVTYLRSIGIEPEEDTVVFGIAARLTPVKDIATLIRAFGPVAKDHPNIRLLIAGDGEQRQMLMELATELCPPGSFKFAGWVSDMTSFYNAVDVNMLTSLSEMFPYVIPEGARMHCATIASNVGGIPYIIEHGVTGLLFTPQDVGTLAAHITKLTENTQMRLQLAENLHERASREFSVDSTVRKQIEIYQTILRREKLPKHGRRGVLICGAYGKGNAGDDAILKKILEQMRAIDADMPLHVLSHDPAQTRLRYRVGAVHAFDPFRFLTLMFRAKLYLSGGGSLIQNETSRRSLHYYLLSIWLAKHCGCRVMMYGCGIGPVTGARDRSLTARIINSCVDAVTLREDLSRQELADMGVTKPRIVLTADPALLLQPASDSAVSGFFLSSDLDPDGRYAMFSLRPWKDLDEHLQAIVDAADYVNKKYGLTPVFLALEPGRDLEVNRRAAGMLSCESAVLPAPENEQITIGIMKRMNVIVSMRLHALIFASSVGVPLVAVSYDPKVTGFMKYLGQKHCLELCDVTRQSLCDEISSALDAQEPYSVSRLQQLADENERVARELLEGKQ